ncbi:MAG: aminotransferase class III-fold pyridoxal phosphate-dependent enzyme [Clostridia bacterium]
MIFAKKHEILFNSGEVQQSFGRTGKWFGIEHYDIIPDAVLMAKSIASGMPLSANVAREEIMQKGDYAEMGYSSSFIHDEL